MTRIAAAITARDAAHILPDLFASLATQVDVLVVGVDERTTDETREVARAAGAIVGDVSLLRDGVMDFAQGRTQTWGLIPLDCEWAIWLDADDVLIARGGMTLADLIAEAPPATESIWLMYAYARDEKGRITSEHPRERLIRLDAGWSWQSRVHETCHTASGPSAIWAEPPTMLEPTDQPRSTQARIYVDHKNRGVSETDRRARNLPILERMIEEDPQDFRAVKEMAELHYASGDHDEAAAWFDRFLALTQHSQGTPLEERWQAVVWKSRCERRAGRTLDAMRSADRALLMCPQYADAYFELMYGYIIEGHWTKAIWWFEEGQKRARPTGILPTSPLDYDFSPFASAYVAYEQLGQYGKAADCVEQALRVKPEHEDLQGTYRALVHMAGRRQMVDTAVQSADYLLEMGEPIKARAVLEALPAGTAEDFEILLGPVREKIAAATVSLADHRLVRLGTAQPPIEPARWLLARLRDARSVLTVDLDPIPLARAGIRTVSISADPIAVRNGNLAAVEVGLLALVDAPDDTPQVHPFHVHAPDCFHIHQAACHANEDETADLVCEEPTDVLICGNEVHEHIPWTAACDLCGPVLRVPEFTADSLVHWIVSDPEKISDRARAAGPYDAIVLADTITECRDVQVLLEQAEQMAPRVLLTLPDGTAPPSDRRRRLRAFSRLDLETLVWKRGRFIECHLLDGEGDRIGLEYRPGETSFDRFSLVIYCGPGLERWTPDQVDTVGLGGSETAVVNLSKALVLAGMRVMVYAETEGVWDGVFYRHHRRWVPSNPVNAFVAWRNPALFDQNIFADVKLLWLHDVDAGDALTDERAKKIDLVLGVSEWHAAHLRERHPNVAQKVDVLPNGIDPERFTPMLLGYHERIERDLDRILYVSSPDRGLERALVMWPFVKKALPDAELHVFYGWENYDRLGRPRGFKDWIMDKAKAEGVTWHGRIGQRELAREMMRSGALWYPGPHGFEETFCISALEAQAAGCVPVTRDNGALPETNRFGICLPTAEATVLDQIRALIAARDAPEDSPEIPDRTRIPETRSVMRAWALEQTWEKSASILMEHLRALVPEAEAVES